MLRRLLLKGGLGATVAAKAYAGNRSRSYVNPMAAPTGGMSIPVGGGEAMQANSDIVHTAHRELRRRRSAVSRRRIYQDGVYYPDIEEWRSVSPAAKRVISADRYFRRQDEDWNLYTTVMRAFGLEPGERDEHY